MLKDSRGVALTATNQAAVDAFDRVVEAYLRFGRDTGVLLKRVAAEDPDMPMAHVLRGSFFHLRGNAALLPRARRRLETAEAARASLMPRERMTDRTSGQLGKSVAGPIDFSGDRHA